MLSNNVWSQIVARDVTSRWSKNSDESSLPWHQADVEAKMKIEVSDLSDDKSVRKHYSISLATFLIMSSNLLHCCQDSESHREDINHEWGPPITQRCWLILILLVSVIPDSGLRIISILKTGNVSECLSWMIPVQVDIISTLPRVRLYFVNIKWWVCQGNIMTHSQH